MQSWKRALEIFDDRIQGRFFEPINTLKGKDINQNGFAVMALDCLLVETLYQFYSSITEPKFCIVAGKETQALEVSLLHVDKLKNIEPYRYVDFHM